MKRTSSLSFLALVVLALGVALPAAAQSANGEFTFDHDNTTKSIQFNVKRAGNATGAKGNLTFSGATEYTEQDGDGDGETVPSGLTTVSVEVDFDCFIVHPNGKRAAASGLVTASSVPGLVGRRGLLTVEDNGEGVNQPDPDRFTWGLYRQRGTWVPTDAELTFDPGAGLTWFADDFERPTDPVDNPVISSVQPDPGDCRGFSLSSYAVEDLIHGSGNVQIKP